MGQQQLLLLVLGIVIVGIAVVAGIQAFSEGKQKAEQDAAVSDAMRIIADVQAWKLKPGAFGGGADNEDAEDFTGVTFKALGYPTAPEGHYATVNGCYVLAGAASGATLNLYKSSETETDDNGTPDTSDDVQVTSCNEQTEIATVTITGTGTSQESLSWEYN